MRRDPPLIQAGKVVHVVGRVTDEVFSFLGPAATAIARSGREQVVVMIDELRFRHHVARLHESAELVMAQRQPNPFKQWSSMREACHKAMSSGPLHAVHLHGVLPALVGARAVRAAGVDVPVFFSPHGSSVIGTLRGLGRLGKLGWMLLGSKRPAAIVNQAQETSAFEHWASSELVESPVAEAYFNVSRRETRHPLVVTGGRSPHVRSVELVAQLAVLLSGEEELRISFNWLGAVDEVSRLRLAAAGVSVFEVSGDADCAARLASGWIHLAPGMTRGFPLLLAEAMAAGLPCVAFDCLPHRDLIHDGENGYLCKTNREMIERIALLIDDPALREQIGRAGQAQARARFGEKQFGDKLLAAYALE